jgi:hypothetical protein
MATQAVNPRTGVVFKRLFLYVRHVLSAAASCTMWEHYMKKLSKCKSSCQAQSTRLQEFSLRMNTCVLGDMLTGSPGNPDKVRYMLCQYPWSE